MHRLQCTSRRGSGMILALTVLTMIIILGVGFVSIASSSLVAAKRDGLRARALACAEAGIDRSIGLLLTQPAAGELPGVWRCETWYTETLASGESYKIRVVDGTGISAGKILVTSVGTATSGSTSTTRTIEAVMDLDCENVCVWNNVIFGGVGQAGKSINGNVKIRGSVHLLGDGEEYTDLDADGHWDDTETYTDSNGNGAYDFGEPFVDTDLDGHRDAREPFVDTNGNGTRDPALTVTDMASEISGDANIGNNYSDLVADLRSRVPPIVKSPFGGEMVESLEAKLRVKHGTVNISGGATVGDPNQIGNLLKETADATYVNDGFGGNSGVGNVYSDNGYANGYDLGDGIVTMPVIDTGQYTKYGVTYSNYLHYLQSNATVVSGSVDIVYGVPQTIVGPNGSLVVDANGNMTITGVVYVTGNISFGPKNTGITYSGSGTLVTPASMYVHCDVLPASTFPTVDALGLVAGDKIELATGSGDSQLKMALAMYAQHRVVSYKQSQIVGTIVSSYYEMFNVPSIFQSPDLVDHLPPGLPGADPVWVASLSVESWRESPN